MNTTALDMDVAPADYDALADLFLDNVPVPPTAALNGRCGASAASDATSTSLCIEGVIAGHLPVIASAWVTQYARHQADVAHEPVALLRLAAGQALLDLVLPKGMPPPAAVVPHPSEPIETILRRVGGVCRRWIIRVDEPGEADLLSQSGLTGVALLTGADDPAILASYQTIKSMAGDSLAPSAPALTLVVMGAGDDKADHAERKLRRAAATFLARTIDPAVRIPRIGSTLAIQLHRARTTLTVSDAIEIISRPPTPMEAAPAPVISPMPAMAAEPARMAPAPVTAPSTSRLGPLATPMDPRAAQLKSLRLTALAMTCPYTPAITLATDAAGRLHLVAETSLGAAESAQRLLTAAAWTVDHAPLLTAACPVLRSAAEPTLHILTTQAKQVRGLLDTGMRLHLVSEVEVGGQVGWAVAELN